MNNRHDAAAIKIASFSSRFTAFIIDGAIILAAWIAFGQIMPAHLGSMWPAQQAALIGAAAMLFAILYSLFFYAVMKQTPGMRTARIAVVDRDGRSAGMAQFLVRLAPWWICLAGFLLSWMLAAQAWHAYDQSAGWVIYSPIGAEMHGTTYRIASFLILTPAAVFAVQIASLIATRGKSALHDMLSRTALHGGER